MGNPKEKIMDGTYRALSKHGYADLSIKKIAQESDNSKSNIYYHFDDKEELMLAFLDHMEDHVKQNHASLEDNNPEEMLDSLLDMALGVEDDQQWEFHKAFLEIKALGPKSPEFAEKFRQIDSLITDNITEILEALEVKESEMTAEIIASCIEGSVIRKVSTSDREGLKKLKRSIKELLDQNIVDGC